MAPRAPVPGPAGGQSGMTAQEHAIAAARQAYRLEVLPLREQVSDLVDQVGWRRARPVVEEVLKVHASGPRGGWWSKVTRRRAVELIAVLSQLAAGAGEGQQKLF